MLDFPGLESRSLRAEEGHPEALPPTQDVTTGLIKGSSGSASPGGVPGQPVSPPPLLGFSSSLTRRIPVPVPT